MTVIPAFGMPGGFEWVMIFLALLLIFGAKRLPEIARSLGKASNEFKKARREFSDAVDDVTREPPPASKPAKAEDSSATNDPPKTT
jgi:sec-independent protein translocase protein TatA